MVFGQLYRSAAVIGAGDDLPPVALPDRWTGQPGTRAPHLWLVADGEPRSTLDLFGRDWVLLADGDAWPDAAGRASTALGIDLVVHRIGTDVRTADPAALPAALGLSTGGAVLVRPDGYIAWRSAAAPDDAADALTRALAQVAAAGQGAPAVA
jgi:putative polyketide hydroxylase